MNQNSMSRVVFSLFCLCYMPSYNWSLNYWHLHDVHVLTYMHIWQKESWHTIARGSTLYFYDLWTVYIYRVDTHIRHSYLFLLLFSVQTKHWRLPCIFLPFVLIVVDYMYSTGCCIGRINLLRVKLYFLTE